MNKRRHKGMKSEVRARNCQEFRTIRTLNAKLIVEIGRRAEFREVSQNKDNKGLVATQESTMISNNS